MAKIAEVDPIPVAERKPEATRPSLGAPVGVSVPRTRAKRLLQGRGRYTDDRGVPGVLHAAFVRSPYPAARIRHIDGAVARGMAGVVLVATGGDIAARCKPYAGIHQLFAGMRSPEQWPLAIDRALWQGEPVVAVVADTRAQAEDAADRVTIDWEPLPPVTDVEAAVAPDAPLVHPAMETNVAYEARVSHGTQGVRGPDDVTVAATFRFGRHTGVPLETRTIIAEFDPATPALLVTQSHQCPAQQQVLYARLLDLPDHAVRVVCPDVGGAYGIKQQLYGDELAVCVLSMMLKRPVKFVADRMESLVSDIHAREHVVHASLTLDREGRIRAMAVDDLFAIGAYSQYPRSSVGEGNHVLRLTGAPYDLDAFEGRMRMVLQTKPLVGHYRAVGHPVAVAVTEVLLEEAARRAKLDAATVRLRSYIAPDAYPHASHGGFAFEHLSLQACHARIVARMNLDALRAEQRRRGSARVRLGVGLAAFVELTGTGPGYYGPGGAPVSAQDGCLVRLEPSGRVRCAPSVTDQGQGTDQAVAQVVAATLGVPVEDVMVDSGDTGVMPLGGGAWASRGASIGVAAAHRAADALRDNILEIASHMLKRSPDSLDVIDRCVVSRSDGLPLATLADIARVGYYRQDTLPADVQPELAVIRHYVPTRGAIITNGIQGAVVEVDTETGIVRLLRHYVVHDSGTVLNPMLLDEQIRGGVVQGLGAALYEEIPYGEDGQMLAGSLADYLLPMSGEMPDIVVDHITEPDPGTVVGAKGAGEAGTAGACGAVLNAVNDALAPLGALLTQIPVTPERVLRALGVISSKEQK